MPDPTTTETTETTAPKPSDSSAPGAPTGEAEAASAREKAAGDTAAQSGKTVADRTEPPASGPPEKYALHVANGDLVPADAVKAFEEEARFLGLPNDKAQALLTRRVEQFLDLVHADEVELIGDPVFGGDKLPNTQRLAEAAYNRFAPVGDPYGDGLRQLIRESGRGQSKFLVALLARVGQAMDEDQTLTAGAGARAEVKSHRTADLMYRNTTSKDVFVKS